MLSFFKKKNLNLYFNFLLIFALAFIVLQIKSPADLAQTSLKKQTSIDVIKTCQGKETYECFEPVFKQMYDEIGPQQTLANLENLSETNSDVRRDCHPVAHELGRYAFSKIGDAVKAFSYGSTICASGYLHGVMEGYLRKIRAEHKKLQDEIVSLCDQKEGTTAFMSFQCLHGLGHGLTEYYGEDIMKSLPLCDKLKTGWDQESCYGGVFMENIVASTAPGHKSLYLKPTEPEYPCNSVEQKYKFSCYYLISSWFLQLTGYNYKSAFGLCDSINQDFISTCYQSMGRDISGSTLRNPKQSAQICTQGQEKFYDDCIIGVVKDFTNTTAQISEAKEFCALVKEGSKPVCFQAAGEILRDIYPNKNKLVEVCQQLTSQEPKFLKNCSG